MTTATKMNPEIKTQWLEALRSGDYEQTDNYLHRPGDGFCCLGVLCDLHMKATDGASWEQEAETSSGMTYPSEEGNHTTVMPEEVVKWAGLPDENPYIDGIKSYTLAYLNDDGKTFNEIADVIEETF